MRRRVALIGSRNWPIQKQHMVRQYIYTLEKGTVVLTGNDRGVQSYASEWCGRRFLELITIPVDYFKDGGEAQLVRDRVLIDDANFLTAFWDGKDPLTYRAIEYAEKRWMPVMVFLPRRLPPERDPGLTLIIEAQFDRICSVANIDV